MIKIPRRDRIPIRAVKRLDSLVERARDLNPAKLMKGGIYGRGSGLRRVLRMLGRIFELKFVLNVVGLIIVDGVLNCESGEIRRLLFGQVERKKRLSVPLVSGYGKTVLLLRDRHRS